MAYPPQPPQPQPDQPGPWAGAPGQGAPQGYDPSSGPAWQPPRVPPNHSYGQPPGTGPQQPGYGQPPTPGLQHPGHPLGPASQQPDYGQQPNQGAPQSDPGQPYGGYPNNGQPDGGYPNNGQPDGGYQGGFPATGQPGNGYPGTGQPGSSYPGAGQPGNGYPGTGQPGNGYPGNGQPGNAYPEGGYPGAGHPVGAYPNGGYPGGGYPGGGYPGGHPGGQFPPPGYAPMPPAPTRNNALIIGLTVGLAVLLLGGAGLGAYFYLRPPGPPSTVALETDAPATTPPPSPDPSPSQPEEEEDEPVPTDDPSPTSTSAQAGSPITESEFKDWNFALGQTKFRANKVGGWDYNTCTPVDGKGSVLTKNKCERAVQLAYSAYNGHLKAVQLLMSFPNAQAAKTTANRLAKLSSDAVKWRTDKSIANYSYGKIISSASKNYVIVTIVTADKSASSKAADFHAYLQTDHASYFLFRDQTISS